MIKKNYKRTTEEVRVYFAAEGCELIDTYEGCMKPMLYRCKCGEIGKTSWNNFTKGKRCGHCTKWGMKKKRTPEQVKEVLAERGIDFLDTEFRGVHSKHWFRCKCGKEFETSFSAVYYEKRDCRECGLKKGKKENHHAWIPDREEKRRRELFRKKCYKALSSSLKAFKIRKTRRTHELLGYTPQQLRDHVESHPNWELVKDAKWHLDHIFPIQAFLDHGIDDIKLINCLENLCPMTQFENIKKHANYDKESFISWLNMKKTQIYLAPRSKDFYF